MSGHGLSGGGSSGGGSSRAGARGSTGSLGGSSMVGGGYFGALASRAAEPSDVSAAPVPALASSSPLAQFDQRLNLGLEVPGVLSDDGAALGGDPFEANSAAGADSSAGVGAPTMNLSGVGQAVRGAASTAPMSSALPSIPTMHHPVRARSLGAEVAGAGLTHASASVDGVRSFAAHSSNHTRRGEVAAVQPAPLGPVTDPRTPAIERTERVGAVNGSLEPASSGAPPSSRSTSSRSATPQESEVSRAAGGRDQAQALREALSRVQSWMQRPAATQSAAPAQSRSAASSAPQTLVQGSRASRLDEGFSAAHASPQLVIGRIEIEVAPAPTTRAPERRTLFRGAQPSRSSDSAFKPSFGVRQR